MNNKTTNNDPKVSEEKKLSIVKQVSQNRLQDKIQEDLITEKTTKTMKINFKKIPGHGT